MKFLTGLLLTVFSLTILAQTVPVEISVPNGRIIIPTSNIPQPGRANTNFEIFIPKNHNNQTIEGETPASLACVYGLTTQVPGCSIATTTAVPNTGWGAVGIVDAFDSPYIATNLTTYSSQFNLPACTKANNCFQQIYATSVQSGTCTTTHTPPTEDENWGTEESIDVEMAHAMAPNTKIILVEAASFNINDMMCAEQIATQYVQAAGGGEISNSWGNPETSTELTHDQFFQGSGIVYVAAVGDSATHSAYPSTSPYVIAAGGSELVRDSNGNLIDEVAWSFNPATGTGTNGGPSFYEPRPAYQNIVQSQVGAMRGTPDIAFVASGETGPAIYDANPNAISPGWTVAYGTSIASPALAGIINSADSLRPLSQRATSTTQELTRIYTSYIKNYRQNWHDVVSGHNIYPALPGYDFTTGIGTPRGLQGK